jgi:uncharacterized repeat protein (TIGR01451 family)
MFSSRLSYRGWVLGAVSLLLALPLVSLPPGGSAQAAPGSPGVPGASTVLYAEDFEDGTAIGSEEIEAYVGATGMMYTADSYWLRASRCNGFILQYLPAAPFPAGYCNNLSNDWLNVRVKSYALGLLPGGTPTSNRALSNNTASYLDSDAIGGDGDIQPSNNQRVFATASQLSFPLSNRFVTFSVDAAATACFANPPLLRFYLLNAAGVEVPVSTSAIKPCSDPGVKTTVVDGQTVAYGRYAANSSILMNGGSFGIVLRNEQGKSAGNDGAIDNIRVLDVSPQLDKAFVPPITAVGAKSKMTFTVTNTSELALKPGWKFTDTLPAGLTVANPVNFTSTCTNASVVAVAGGSTTAFTGDLAKGAASCTVSGCHLDHHGFLHQWPQ